MVPLRTELLHSCALAVAVFLASPSSAQIAVGDYTVSGEAVVGGMPSHRTGSESKLEEYRDLPETLVVPELNLVIEPNKKDYFLEFDSNKTGLDDQRYQLRFGKYGLFKFEFQWDQIPHLFNTETARTPYTMNGGRYTLGSKPASTAGTDVRDWVNSDAKQVNLSMYNGLAKFKVTYTPTPGWRFIGSYGSQNVAGKRAFGAYFGPSPGSYNITELAEPLDYQTHNIELGGEYAGKGWTIGLKYNASLFHNNNSSLTWDNPLNPGIGSSCTSEAVYNNGLGTGPCQGRIDLYPSNQAHTFSLTGTGDLPFKTHFMSTVSYGWRLQDDKFLPFTTNSGLAPFNTRASLPRDSLDGDVRPLMVNATLVNRFFNSVDLKAYYRLYDYDNRSKRVFFQNGLVINDQGPAAILPNPTLECPTATTLPDGCVKTFPYSYSKQNIGFDGSYKVTRWLTAKMSYVWEKFHRTQAREVLDSDEHTFGPTFDLRPNPWVLLRMSYRRGLRQPDSYDAGRNAVIETSESPEDIRDARLAALRKFDEAARNRDKFNMFVQVSPLDNLTLHGGFDFLNDRYPDSPIGVQNDISYVPSLGFVYAPVEWLSVFADYNWERSDWKMRAMERSSTAQTPETDPDRVWRSRGRDQVHTFSVGSDIGLVKNLLKMRLQYTYSNGHSLVRASGDSAGVGATDYPAINNTWHEFLARFEYAVHKNVGLMLGYYYNNYNSTDFGVDIMKPWMGDVDTGTNVQRSIFLGDNGKGSYVAHIGFVGLKLKF